jgi:hypothetical protein
VVSRPVFLGVGSSFGAYKQSFLSLFCRTIPFSSLGAPFLTRGRVCNILVQFNVAPESKSRRTNDTILLPHVRVPQPRGTGLRIYILQEQSGPGISLGTGFPFCRLLWLAGTTVDVLDQPAHEITPVKVKVLLLVQHTVSRPVYLGIKHPSASREQFLLLSVNHLWTFACLLVLGALCDERSGM